MKNQTTHPVLKTIMLPIVFLMAVLLTLAEWLFESPPEID